ncbi:bifunctional glycosyltransferase/CDP-glycerol:glycerophosphate glycerophosphotransferase [Enterococcus sp. LJL98]
MKKISITVIMPVYNVERYISETLDSLMVQENKNIILKIIIVDDGSIDLTKKIIKKYQEKYDNIELIEEFQIGPGAARNIAIKKSQSDYITFLDGDDLLYPNAYQLLIDSAQKNDADIVVGNVSRFNTTKPFFLSGLHKKIFSNEMEGTHISKYHPLLFDTTSWNKLFKTTFLHKENILFPEGILYEDIPFNMKAHVKSKNTNIILDYVYKWQLRDDTNKSITQSRVDNKNMLDRITAMTLFNQILEETDISQKEFLEEKELKELTLDLKLFLDQLGDADDLYFDYFSEAVKNYVSNMKTDVFETRLPVILRLKYQLLIDKNKKSLFHLINHSNQFNSLKTIQLGNNVYKEISKTDFEEYLTKEDVKMNSDILPISKTQHVSWENNTLKIKGFAFLKYLNTNKNTQIEAKIVCSSTGREKKLPTNLKKDRNITQIYGGGKQEYLLKRYVNYDYSSFVIKIDFNDKEIKSILEEECNIVLTVETAGTKQTIYLGSPVKGVKVRPKDQVINNVVYNVSYDGFWRLKLSSSELGGEITRIQLQGDQVLIEGQTVSKRYQELLLKNFKLNLSKKITITYKNSCFFALFDVSLLFEIPEKESFYIYLLADEKEVKLKVSDSIESASEIYDNFDIFFEKTRNKLLKIFRSEGIHPKVNSLNLETINKKEKYIDLILDYPVEENLSNVKLEIIRENDGSMWNVLPSEVKKEREEYRIHYQIDINENRLSKFGNSSWKFFQKLEISGKKIKQEVIYLNTLGKKQFRIKDNYFDLTKTGSHQLQLKTWLKKSYFDKGPRRMKILKDYLYPLMMRLPQKNNYVMFESYWGRSYSCNPKAIYEQMIIDYPNMVGIWSFNNPYTEIQGVGKRVKRNSWKYYYYLARSRYFFNNVNWPTEYLKREKSIEVQTLHGTFLKTMGLDVANEVNTPQKLEGFRTRHKRWDYLVSPSSFMTDISKRVFEFEGEMLEFGFPRNDLLIVESQETERLKETLNEKLSIPKNKKVILYAPTYRTKNGFNLELDIEKMRDELADDYVLLVRLHYFVAKNLDLSNVEDFVINVCNYPDVQELLLITDVLITDYSSIMFDYANLNKPILFFTYDLEYYRDVLRGMYLDFEEEAPGRLCSTTDELVQSLQDMFAYEQKYYLSRQKFREKFNQYETGQSSSLILKRVLLEGEVKHEKM